MIDLKLCSPVCMSYGGGMSKQSSSESSASILLSANSVSLCQEVSGTESQVDEMLNNV